MGGTKRLCRLFAVTALCLPSFPVFAAGALDQRLPIPVSSSLALVQNHKALRGKISEEDRQKFTEAIGYLGSIICDDDRAAKLNKERLLILLLANKSPRQIIVIGHLAHVAQLDRTIRGDDPSLDPSDKAYNESIRKRAEIYRTASLAIIDEYSRGFDEKLIGIPEVIP